MLKRNFTAQLQKPQKLRSLNSNQSTPNLKIIINSKSNHGTRKRSKLENEADPKLEKASLIKIRKEASRHTKLNQPQVSNAL